MNEVCKAHSGVAQMVEDVKDDTNKQWEEINKIKNRAPTWCTILLMVMSALMGSILTYAALIGKLSQAAQAAQ